MAWFLGLLKSGFVFLGELFKAINQKQLLDAGGAIQRDKQNEVLQEQKDIAKAIDADAANLDNEWLLPPEKRSKRL